MLDSLYIAATGMQAQQLNVDTIANNLANANTVGFKKARVGFADIVVREASLASRPQELQMEGLAGPLAPPSAGGAGVTVATLARLFDAGDLKQTGSPFDVAIRGDGFIEVALTDGSRGFTRGGTLHVNADGMLVAEAGYVVRPGIAVPQNATGIVIEADGRVRVSMPGQASPVDVGELELVRFANPSGLAAAGGNVYRSTDASGEAIPARAGEEGAGALAQGFLEGSNVKMVDEMVNLMVAQRAYEASVKVIQASDEMLGLVNSLRK